MIVAFVYDFPHQKSVNGLLSLAAHGYSNVICLAAPKKQLNIPHSKIRITPIINPLHPRQVAQALGFEYIQTEHDSLVARHYASDCKIGVILGARILVKGLTELLPIINLHPGHIPDNRGLDNIKNAIWHNWPQEITAHVIDHSIDRGYLIERKLIDVYEDDTMLDIFIRMQAEEQHMLIRAVDKVLAGDYSKERLGEGNYFSAMSPWEERDILKLFEHYKKNYEYIKLDFQC